MTSPEARTDAADAAAMRAAGEASAASQRAGFVSTPATRAAGRNYRVMADRAATLRNINHRPGGDA